LILVLPSFAQDSPKPKPNWIIPLPDIDGDPVAGRDNAEWCRACHGLEGYSTHNYYPNLAGQKEHYLAYQLHYFDSGQRPTRLMTPITQGLTDTDIEVKGFANDAFMVEVEAVVALR
jgi:hypothetical protein